MGVPKFFRWISERYPCLSELVREYQIPEFDNLYLDMNGIIHMCSHPNDFDPHFRISEEKIFKDIFHYIEILFRMIQPRKLFFMAVDGVAPRAKMNQQRGRRFRSAKEAEVLEQKAREKGEELPHEERFDSNCITPGTVFMARLHEQLKYFVTYKVTTDTLWQKCKVILSGHETPGEGEHKIMDYIRFTKSQPNYEPNTRHCLYGLDADLIMLGLCSHEPHFSLLREEVKFNKKQKRTSTPEETTFFLLHLSLMRDYLELEFGALKSSLPFSFDIEKIIDDWVLMGFLVGNDFIPPLPDMHIANGALPTLYQAYIEILPSLGGYINEGGTLNLSRFQKYMEKLSAFDFDQFRDTYADLKYFEGKRGGRKLGGKERISYRNTKTCDENGKVDEMNDAEEKQSSNPELAALIKSTDDILLEGPSSGEEEDDDIFDIDDYDEEESDNALFFLEFCQHKKHYYMNKLEYENVTSEVLRSQAEGFVRAIQWNLNYYYKGVCSWSWYYPHHYAPYISDIRNFSDLKLEFEMGVPFFPFQQLLAVLPAASKKLLPEPYQALMVNDDSPIINYYPSSFRTDLNGKKQEWEAVVLIPFIEENLLLDAMAPCNMLLTEEEKKRNSIGPMLIYNYSKDDLGCYKSPGYFPVLSNNHAKMVPMWRDELYVEHNELVKGLCFGTRLDVYFPGFPTLKHISHTASIQKSKVKVFEMPSRGDNMILKLTDQGKPNLKEVAAQLLNKEIYVEWPHLVEAKVVAVSDKELRYSLVDDSDQNPASNLTKTPKFNIEEVKGSIGALWSVQRRNIQERYMNRLGVDIGATNILIYAASMVGRKYVFGPTGRITLDKQWNKTPSPYALQTTVKDISVHDSSFVQFKSLQDVFPAKTICFLLGHPHYGSMGEVLEGGTGGVRSGRVKVNMTVNQEPPLDAVRKKQQDMRIHYMQGSVAAQRLGISTHLVSRITGTIYIVKGERDDIIDGGMKTNVGLNLKFNKKNEEVPSYTRKENSVWLYSVKAVELVGSYMQKFPELFDYLSNHTGNDVFFEADVFPNDNGSDKVLSIANWLKEQPYYKVDRQLCGSEVLEVELVQEVEKSVDTFYEANYRVKTVTMQVKPYLLYKSALQVGSLTPDPSTTNCLFDRVVNVRDCYTVPLGLKGTIIGIHKAEKEAEYMYDIVFDKPFAGGLSLNCSANRGYRVSRTAIINLSHGQRIEQVKTMNKPTAVVQPTGNSVVQEGPLYTFSSPWSSRHHQQQRPQSSASSGTASRPTSAFASWNTRPNNGNLFGGSPLYHAINMAGSGLPPVRGSSIQGASLVPFTQGGNVLRQPQTSQQQPQVASKMLKGTQAQQKQQDYSFIMKNDGPTTDQGSLTSPTEFQALWSELQKAAGAVTSGSPTGNKTDATPTLSIPLQEVGDSGTELLKKMLRIPDETTNTPQQAPPLLQNMKQVSVQEIFEHARATETKRTSRNENPNYCVQLLHTFQVKGLGIPRYNYLPNQEDGSVMAQVILPNRCIFSGESASTREQASENAAEVALHQLGIEIVTAVDTTGINNTSITGINPITNNLPTPPQQWYQQGWPLNPHRQNRVQSHQGYQQARQGGEPLLDWRRSNDTGTGRMFENTQVSFNKQIIGRPQQHQLPYIPPFTIHPQTWATSNNWHQQPPQPAEEPRPSSQFVPLQAVKQHRNKTSSTSTPVQKYANGVAVKPVTYVPVSTGEVDSGTPTVIKDNSTVTHTTSNSPLKPIVPRQRKSRIAANFGNVNNVTE